MASRNWQNIFQKGQGFSEQAITQFSSLEVDVATALAYATGSITAVNAKQAPYSATGLGIADDTAALQAALTAAAGGSLFIPKGTYLVSAELLYATATSGSVMIVGEGAGTILKASGAANKVLHITGTAGVTRAYLTISDLQIQSATSGVSAAGIHLDGISDYQIHDVVVDGKSKMTNGLQLTGTQQGEISGGYITGCVTGLRLEKSSTVASNGADIHGVSMGAQSGTNVVLDGCDDVFFRGNHLTGTPIQIDVPTAGNGLLVIAFNHLELHSTAGIRLTAAQRAYISGNYFAGSVGQTELNVVNGAASVIDGNLFSANVTLGAAADSLVFANNSTGATVTDASTNLTAYGNRAFGGTGVPKGGINFPSGSYVGVNGRVPSSGAELAVNGRVAVAASVAGPASYFQREDTATATSKALEVLRSDAGSLFRVLHGGRFDVHAGLQRGLSAAAYSASITPDAMLSDWQTITATNATAFAVNAPTNPPDSTHTQALVIEISNTSGGAMGAITWNAIFKFAGFTWTNPATGFKRFARFQWNGAAWICVGVATADYS